MNIEKTVMPIAKKKDSVISIDVIVSKESGNFIEEKIPSDFLTSSEVDDVIELSILVGKSKQVSSLHLNKVFSDFNQSQIITDIDNCDSPVSFLCAIEDKAYDIIFVDYHMEGVELNALLSFVTYQCPDAEVIVTSAPVWNTATERDDFMSMCTKCCHEAFNEINIMNVVKKLQGNM